MRYQVLEVTKVTATQLVCGPCGNLTKRFRREDGGEVGQHFRYAVEATPEILAEYDAQLQVKRRWQKATETLDTLIDKPLHKLGLDTDQLEKLAEAWVEVQKMKAQ